MMSFYFQKKNGKGELEEKAIVHVSIDKDLGVLKFDVDLDSLPKIDLGLDGLEVIVDFEVHGFANNKTFYTDSNGLEMQKRVLNYRPTWDL